MGKREWGWRKGRGGRYGEREEVGRDIWREMGREGGREKCRKREREREGERRIFREGRVARGERESIFWNFITHAQETTRVTVGKNKCK